MFRILLIYLLKILYSPLWLLALLILVLVKGFNIAREESDYFVDECLKCWKDYWVIGNDDRDDL